MAIDDETPRAQVTLSGADEATGEEKKRRQEGESAQDFLRRKIREGLERHRRKPMSPALIKVFRAEIEEAIASLATDGALELPDRTGVRAGDVRELEGRAWGTMAEGERPPAEVPDQAQAVFTGHKVHASGQTTGRLAIEIEPVGRWEWEEGEAPIGAGWRVVAALQEARARVLEGLRRGGGPG